MLGDESDGDFYLIKRFHADITATHADVTSATFITGQRAATIIIFAQQSNRDSSKLEKLAAGLGCAN